MSNLINYKNLAIGVGDKVKISQKVIEGDKERKQIFLGTIIKIKGDSNNKTITVRKIGVNQIGIEKIFQLNNPFLEDIEITKSGLSGSRKSSLYYTRYKSKKEIDKIFSRNNRRSNKKS